MSTVYTDAIYTPSTFGLSVSSTGYFSASSSGNTITILSAGQSLYQVPVIGFAYNEAEWSVATPLAARKKILVIPTVHSGNHSGDDYTVITVGVSALGGLSFAILDKAGNQNNLVYDVNASFVLLSPTATYYGISAVQNDMDNTSPGQASDKNTRRKRLLGFY